MDDLEGNVRIRLTICEAGGGKLLTKQIRRKADGSIEKKAPAMPMRGSFQDCALEGLPSEILAELSTLLGRLTKYQALIASPLPTPLAPDGKKWRLHLAKDDAGQGNSLSRTQETFKPVEGPALGFLDIDIPAPLRSHIGGAVELREKVLLPAWQGFVNVVMLIRASVSAGVKLADEPQPLPTGFHVFFVISDGRRLGDLAQALFDRLALCGNAVVEPSARGSELRRSLVDIGAAKGAERLIFEADPVLLGLGLEAVERECFLFPGADMPAGMLDAAAAIEGLKLTAEEQQQLLQTWREASAAARPECDRCREEWLIGRGKEIETTRGLEPEAARTAARVETAWFDAGELTADFPIPLDDGSSPTVHEILSNPDRYKGARGYSLDESPSRRGVTFLWPYASKPDPAIGKPEGPWLHSYEHGGRYFRLVSERIERERKPDASGADLAKDKTPLYELTDFNPWKRSGAADFPLEVFPDVVRDYVVRMAKLTGADISALAMAALHMVSGCADHAFRLQPKQHEPNYKIPPSIWTMIVGRPSTRKSAVVTPVMRLLGRFDHLDAEAVAKLEQEALTAGNPTENGSAWARRRLLVETTVEAASEILSKQDCGVSVVWDELSGFLQGMDQYHKGGSERAFWLQAQHGGRFNIDRIKGKRQINNLSASVFGGLQPSKLEDVAGLTGDGFLQRFAIVHVADAQDETDEPGDPYFEVAMGRLCEHIGRLVPKTFRFEEAASAAYVELANTLRRASDTIYPSEAYGTFVGKQARTVCAYALLLHLMDMGKVHGDETAMGRPVPLETFERALKIVTQFVFPQAEFFYRMDGGQIDSLLRIAAAILKAASDDVLELTTRELGRRTRAIRSLKSDPGKIQGAVSLFVVNGWLTPATMQPNNNTWHVHPRLKGAFADELAMQIAADAELSGLIGEGRTT